MTSQATLNAPPLPAALRQRRAHDRANDAWAYLRELFPAAEVTIDEVVPIQLQAAERHRRTLVITVHSLDPADDDSCEEAKAALLEFLNTRYATRGLPPIPPHHVECYPLPIKEA